MNKGYVYIYDTGDYPKDTYKIGHTTKEDYEDRYDKTANPLSKFLYTKLCYNYKEIETFIKHRYLDKRIPNNRSGRRSEVYKNINKDEVILLIENLADNIILPSPIVTCLRPHQEKAVIAYNQNNNELVRIFMFCSTGKTLVGVNIVKQYKKFLIVVPSISLVNQTLKVYNREIPGYYLCIFSGKLSEPSYFHRQTENEDEIFNYLQNDNVNIICCIHSYHKLAEVCKNINFVFDVCVIDESHNIIDDYDKIKYNVLDNIIARSNVLMTGTETEGLKNVGKLIYSYKYLDALKDDIICDFKIILNMYEGKFKLGLDDETYMNYYVEILKRCIEDYKINHTLIFSHRCKFAKVFSERVNCYYMDGNTSATKRNEIFESFTKDNISAISSVNTINEGIDIPICDSIMFLQPHNTDRDVIQKISRSFRKYDNKVSKIIIPYPTNDDEDFNEHPFKCIIDVLLLMGLNEMQIKDRIEIKCGSSILNGDKNRIISYKEKERIEIEKDKIYLYLIDRNCELSYYKAKRILQDKKIKSKEGYLLYTEMNKIFPKEPDKYFVKWEGWIDYLSIDKRLFYDKEEIKNVLKDIRRDITYAKENERIYRNIKDDKLICYEFIKDLYGVVLENLIPRKIKML